MLTNVCRVAVAMAVIVGTPAWAQTLPEAPGVPPAPLTPAAPPPPAAPAAPAAPVAAARPVDRGELRHQIYVMEGALARAVEFGAQKLNRELRTVVPEMFLLAGSAQARGVYLDGYGIFFDVAVPMLRQSMMWSLRMMLQRDDTGTRDAVAELRRHIQNETNPIARQSLESAIARLEAQASPLAGLGRPAPTGFTAQPSSDTGAGVRPSIMLPDPISGGQGTPPPAGTPTVPTDMPWLMDTNRVYTEAVQRALIDAMIDFSAPMRIGAEEWLTVAARDNEQRDSLAPQDPYEEVVTVLLRIRGADLLEYRAGRIDKDEARKRVVVGEF